MLNFCPFDLEISGVLGASAFDWKFETLILLLILALALGNPGDLAVPLLIGVFRGSSFAPDSVPFVLLLD